MEAAICPKVRVWMAAFGCAVAALLVISPAAKAGIVTDGVPTDGGCPSIADKPGAVSHVDYQGMKHITYCYGPIDIQPGQNVIRLNLAKDPGGSNLWPSEPGYITRFDPEFVYEDGSVPGVDVLHLHHAVWAINGAPTYAAGEEKTITQLPKGFGYRSMPTDTWFLNDMLHDLVAQPAKVYLVWRVDFVPDGSLGAVGMKTVHSQWMDVAGNPSFYPVFDALRKYGQNGTYTFPDQAPPSDRQRCTGTGGLLAWPKGAHGCIGAAQSWTPDHDVTLIGTAGHLHPGGLNTQLRDTRTTGGVSHTNTLFTSDANYYEPAGEVSWDVAMGATLPSWRVGVKAGDTVSVHATYDTKRADWYEVMGIMVVAVYDGTLPGDPSVKDAQASNIPQDQALTHTHLRENDNHGGGQTSAPNPLSLWSAPAPNNTIDILKFSYLGDQNAGPSVPTIEPGQSLTFHNSDANPDDNAFHTITACKDPCTGTTGIAYPISNGPVTFDSGELGYNGQRDSFPGADAPAADTDTWKTPSDLPSGTYTYFCRIHPFMRGAFRVEPQTGPVQTLNAKKDQELGTAAVSETLDKPATVALQARVKGGKGAGQSSTSRVLSQALDAKQSTLSLDPKVKTKIKLKFSKAARKRIRATLATGGSRKVVVTATATDRFGKTSTAKAGFRLTG